MDISVSLQDYEDFDSEVTLDLPEVEALTESSLIPKIGCFLGLDISENSSGICLYEDGVKKSYNISLNLCENLLFREVLSRRLLKTNLLEYISGKCFDLIIIEDAFQGLNPQTTRLLYALNTAIDELILDNEISCKKFLRVSNQTWKSWLYTVDSEGLFKGLKDKLKIEKCLGLLGVHEEGEGYQDRLDACGMLLGYFLCEDKVKEKESKNKLKRVSLSDVEVFYEEDADLALSQYNAETLTKILVSEKRWSKSKILDYLTESPDKIFVSSDIVKLGRLADELGLPYLEYGGYLVFWVKPKKIKKYLKEEK